MKILLGLLLIVALAFAGQTIDKDLQHGHTDQYFDLLKTAKHNGKLTVHIIPHTHDDVGWLKTPDQYYSGARDDIQRAGVQYVLNGIYDQLMKDPKKKFTYVEMAFFQKWWYEQSDETKQNVQKLVDEGRLHFVNAGWSMSDEANVHYEDFINNMKAGHDFLKAELGYRPTIGWHIDPFGHHSATAALFSEMGFNSWFFARMDHYDKDKRLETKEMEWLWRPFNKTLGSRAEIFTHMMYQHYSAPHGFSYNEFSTDDPIIDDPRLETFNIDNKTEELHDYLIHMAEHYRTGHLLVPFGDDFNYLNAQKMFYNIDKLINYMNEKYDDMELIYSTPYEYVEAVHDADIKWPTKYDDLFPYSDGDDAYWTGYFTSRATLKGYVREVSQDMNTQSLFLGVDHLMNGADTFSAYEDLFNQMGVLQHHDAVAGTEKQHVADNYAKVLSSTHTKARDQFMKSYKQVSQTTLEDLAMCKAHNSTYEECPTLVLDDKNVDEVHLDIVNVANQRSVIARVPVPSANVVLLNANGLQLDSDIICEADTTRNCEMFFPVEMQSFNVQWFTIKKSDSANNIKPMSNEGVLKSPNMSMGIASLDGEVKLEISKNGDGPEAVLMNYMYYNSFQEDEGQRSGAYIFRPAKPDEKPSQFNGFTSYDGFSGKFVQQLRLYGNQVNTTITGNVLTDFVEIESKVFGIPMSEQGQEVILHLTFDKIKNGGVFYTDSMGLEMQERKVDYRPTWDLNVTQHVSENYYPINHGITIMDDKMTLEVLNDRAQGGSSLEDGTMEFMIQRRTYRDDSRGVGEALNETDSSSVDGKGLGVNTKHYLRFYNNTVNHTIAENSRIMQRNIDAPLLYVFGSKRDSRNTNKPLNLADLGYSVSLPDSIKAVYLPQSDGSFFVRFENVLDLISASETTIINVQSYAEALAALAKVDLDSVHEVSNSGLFTMEEMKQQRMHWKGIDYTSPEPDYSSDVTKVELSPQRIRSFVFTFKSSIHDTLVSF